MIRKKNSSTNKPLLFGTDENNIKEMKLFSKYHGSPLWKTLKCSPFNYSVNTRKLYFCMEVSDRDNLIDERVHWS